MGPPLVQELKAGLSAAAGLENDVLLAALKRSPATAPLAAARAQELLDDLLPAHYAHHVCHTSFAKLHALRKMHTNLRRHFCMPCSGCRSCTNQRHDERCIELLLDKTKKAVTPM